MRLQGLVHNYQHSKGQAITTPHVALFIYFYKKSKGMKAIETTAEFDSDGKLHVNNLPKMKNRTVKLLFLIDEIEEENWHKITAAGLSQAYNYDDPEYSENMIKEPNKGYNAD